MSWFDDIIGGVGDVFSSVGDWVGDQFGGSTGSVDPGYDSSWLSMLPTEMTQSAYDWGGYLDTQTGGDWLTQYSPEATAFGSLMPEAYDWAVYTAQQQPQSTSIFDKATDWLNRNEKSVKNALTLANLVRGLSGGDKRKLSPLQALQEKVAMQDLERRARMQEANKALPKLTASRQQLQQPITNRYGRSPAGESKFFTNPVIKEAAGGGYIDGLSGGQDDVVPILGSHGEYMVDASTVSDLGDGNNAAGAERLDAMVRSIREHKRGRKTLPPKAKSPLEYMQ